MTSRKQLFDEALQYYEKLNLVPTEEELEDWVQQAQEDE